MLEGTIASGRTNRNAKCLGRPLPDTFDAKNAHLTGLKMIRITRAVSLPNVSRASDRKDSTSRHGRLLHPSSWAERDDRDLPPKIFSKEVAQKQATPFPRQDLLTARKSFLNKFPGMAPG